jgi:hypothetical protein
VQPLLSAECDIPQTEKPEIHKLTAGYLLTGFLPQSLEFRVRGLTPVASLLDSLSVEKYHFTADNSQKCLRMRNAETFRDAKLVPLRQHHLHFRSKVSVISLLVQFSMIMNY